MRIIAGQFRSRQLKASPPPGTRPTSDKLRETLFNILGESVRGCTFLDGCAGVGAIGIEAISRGAESVVFVEESRKASRMIRQNLQGLEITSGFRILEMDVARSLGVCRREGIRFDVAFIDPPYQRDDVYRETLRRLDDLELISDDAVVIFEHSRRSELPVSSDHLTRVRTLVQGDSALSFYRRKSQ
jgi:16S rRNA (guanine(966)-N(2))-methyltransferase RsmD